MSDLALQVELLPHGRGLPLPAYQSDGAAGLDLLAAIDSSIQLSPLERRLIPTGLRLRIPKGHEGQVRARSGHALRLGLTVLNGPGTIDADYEGELSVLLINLGQEPITIERGMRVAQLVIAPVARVHVQAVPHILARSARGGRGFGSTGD
jgi:dUTP pyrophosphatase